MYTYIYVCVREREKSLGRQSVDINGGPAHPHTHTHTQRVLKFLPKLCGNTSKYVRTLWELMDHLSVFPTSR